VSKLKKYRKKKKMTQFDLAKVIDVPPQRISDFENGKTDLRFGAMVKAADVLGCKVDDLVDR